MIINMHFTGLTDGNNTWRYISYTYLQDQSRRRVRVYRRPEKSKLSGTGNVFGIL